MIDYVWLCEETSILHITAMSRHNFITWALFDPQCFERVHAEPPMNFDHSFECLGEL